MRILSILLFALTAGVLSAAVSPGTPAPGFTLTDTNGTSHNLSDFSGKWVVLEWFNPHCPFVEKFYGAGKMQELQGKYTQKGVVWLAVNSTNPNHKDYETPAALNQMIADKGIAATAILMDEDGKVGKAFGAKTTPHMYVINPQGQVVYAGAIDSIRSWKAEDIAKADNYVVAALEAGMAGQSVATATSQPYGCSVKYAN